MDTNTKHLEISQNSEHHLAQMGVLSRVKHFMLHYLEMCLAMCIGGITLNFLFFWSAGQVGYPDLIQRFPELSIIVIGILLAVPMIIWMRFRGMSWRLTVEMSSTTIILAILLITLSGLGSLPKSNMLEWMKVLACPTMLIPMFLRLDHYTGHSGHSMHSAHDPV